jgi:hypothetical protein
MFLNSTERLLIQIEDLDREIEWEEPFQSRTSSSNFGAKRHGSFTGWIRVMKPFITSKIESKVEREISQRDISSLMN